MAQQRPTTGDAELDAFLRTVEQAAEIDAENNARMLRNHLDGSERVIANKAALRTSGEATQLLAAALGNPTS